jgi:capsular polysaccharide transport system permease protein
MRAEQQNRYLATYVEPHLPEDSLYPARLQMVLLVLLCSALAWAIGVLIFYGIRDHTA